MFGFKSWMHTNYIPFKDLYLIFLIAFCAILFFIIRFVFSKLGKKLGIWKLKGEELLVKTNIISDKMT